MRVSIKTLLAVVLLMVLSVVAAAPLFVPGWYRGHEGTDAIARVLATAYEIRGGHWYPRWLSLASFGKGDPFLNYYSPGFYLATGHLSALGVPILWAIKGACLALFSLGAVGMYLWLREHFGSTGALLSGILYLFAPYHFVDIYVRGAIAEFSALAFLPFLFYGIDLVFRPGKNWAGVAVTGGATLALILVHNLSALMIAPFAFVYFLRGAYLAGAGKKELLVAGFGPLIGMGLAAFYWLPMVLELGYLKGFQSKMTSGYFDLANHFVTPRDWFSTAWGFGVSGAGAADQPSFQIGMVIAFFCATAWLANWFGADRERGFTFFLAFLGLGALVLTTSLAAPFYRILPVYRNVQFPWRFLGPATLFLAAGAGVLGRSGKIFRYRAGEIALIVLAAGLCISLSAGQRSVGERYSGDFDQIAREVLQRQRPLGKITIENDYLPRWVDDEEIVVKVFPAEPWGPAVEVEGLKIGASRMTFAAHCQEVSSLVVPWFYFPGFLVRVDGEEQQARPGQNGFIAFDLPAGRHQVELYFGSTPARRAGWGISLLTLLAALAMWGVWQKKAVLTQSVSGTVESLPD